MAVDDQGRLDALPRGAARAYTIEAVLGHGGFGIVYRARHNELGNVVAVKEYLPIELALRKGASVHPRSAACRAGYEDGLRRFRDEARALIEFQSHPSIVSCRDFFRANGTAYLVMEYEQGMPLSELLRRREAAGRPFDEADLLAVMVPLLEGLQRVHEADMLHRDIKPSNILVRRADERPVLIDFGAAKQMAAEHSKSLAPFTEGYAALEQVGEGKLGPWTDLYAAGAVMWRIVAGCNPPWEPPHPVKVEKRATAALRGETDPMPAARKLGAERFSAGMLEAIDRCLKLNEKERVRGCRELLGLLRGVEAEETGNEPVVKRQDVQAAAIPKTTTKIGSGKRQRRMLTAAGGVLAAVVGWFVLPMWQEARERGEQKARLAKMRKEREAAGVESFRDCEEWERWCPDMVVVPAGSFMMGSPEGEAGRYGWYGWEEGPQHRVTIREPFAVGAYEVTFEEWDACLANGGCDGYRPYDEGWGRGRQPVIYVSWQDAQAYVSWLSGKTGKEYRLLSEAEWEYAARAGNRARYSFGDEITESDANYNMNIGKTQPVGSYRTNGYGLYDMHGNVWEWVQDCRNGSYRGAPSNGDAWEEWIVSVGCFSRVLRGGCWFNYSGNLRSANHSWGDPGLRNYFLGFRVARTLEP